MTNIDATKANVGNTQFSFDDLQTRLTSHVYTLYMNYAFLIKSGVFTVAALSLYHIATEPDVEFRVGLFIFWAASFAFAVVTVSTWTRGAVMATGRSNMFDVIIPIGMAVPEYLLFISIDPAFSKQILTWTTLPWAIWYLWFAFHAFGAWALISTRMKNTVVADYAHNIQPLAEMHMVWMREDRIGAFVSAVIALLIFGATTSVAAAPYNLLQASSAAAISHSIIGILIFGLGIFLTWKAHDRYTTIERYRPATNPVAGP